MLVFTLLFAPQEAQQETTFRSGVSLVRVDIAAMDSKGDILPDLKPGDFRVLDEGTEQKASGFSFETEPLDLILLFETSRGMDSKLHQIVRAVELGFHELSATDRVCVMTFAENTVEWSSFTSDRDAVNRTILLKVVSAKFAGSGNEAAAASDAALRFERERVTGRRRAVLVIADKTDVRSERTADAAVRSLWKADVVLSRLIPDKTEVNRIVASPLSDRTGGATVVAGDPGPAFQESVRRLRRRYTFYYPQPSASSGSERRIVVTLSADAARRFPGSRVYARAGYIAPGGLL